MIVPLLKISNLSVEFGKRGRTVRVIRDVNFEMGQGEAVGLVGESGSGKSVSLTTYIDMVEKLGASITNDPRPCRST